MRKSTRISCEYRFEARQRSNPNAKIAMTYILQHTTYKRRFGADDTLTYVYMSMIYCYYLWDTTTVLTSFDAFMRSYSFNCLSSRIFFLSATEFC